jgi:single-strand DNA-binding protein
LILEGNLVRDSVLSEPVPGFKKCAFSVGVNRFYKNKKNEDVNEVSFFDVEAYGKMAEYCEEKAKKGRGVRVVGRLKQDTWKDSNGKSVSKVYVVAEHIEYRPVKKTEEVSEAADTKTLAEKAAEATTPPEPQTDVQNQTAEEEAVF